MITPKEKAEQLVSSFSPFVYCYMGSGMLTNTSDDEVIKMNAKLCALKVVDEIILEQCKSSELKDAKYQDERLHYWQEVKQEIENL